MEAFENEEESTFDPLSISRYYDKDAFIESMVDSNSDFSMISINCQSLTAKFDSFQIYMEEINNKHPISIILCQETGFNVNTDLSMYQLCNYNMVCKPAQKHSGHGLVIYLHENFIFKELNINNNSTGWESLFLEISLNKINSKKYLIGNVYRKPIELLDTFNIFLNEFNDCLLSLQGKEHPIYIGGDYNINLLDIFRKQHYNTFL